MTCRARACGVYDATCRKASKFMFNTLDLPDKGCCRMTDMQQALRKAAMATVQLNFKADCFRPCAEFVPQAVQRVQLVAHFLH